MRKPFSNRAGKAQTPTFVMLPSGDAPALDALVPGCPKTNLAGPEKRPGTLRAHW